MTATTNMALNVLADRKIVILSTLPPNTIEIPILDTLVKERSDVFQRMWLRAKIVLANPTTQEALVLALLAGMPQIFPASDFVSALDFTCNGEGVAVDKGNVTVSFSGAGDETFEFGVARPRVSFRSNIHGAAGIIVVGHADFFGTIAKVSTAGPGCTQGVAPVGVVGSEGKAFFVAGGFGFLFIGYGKAWVDYSWTVFCVRSRVWIITRVFSRGIIQGLGKRSTAKKCR